MGVSGSAGITIGRPSRWIDYGVVDEHDRLLPPNEVGELVFRPCIPHAMVAEYYKDPERTLEALLRPGAVAVERQREALHPDSRHPAPPFAGLRGSGASAYFPYLPSARPSVTSTGNRIH